MEMVHFLLLTQTIILHIQVPKEWRKRNHTSVTYVRRDTRIWMVSNITRLTRPVATQHYSNKDCNSSSNLHKPRASAARQTFRHDKYLSRLLDLTFCPTKIATWTCGISTSAEWWVTMPIYHDERLVLRTLLSFSSFQDTPRLLSTWGNNENAIGVFLYFPGDWKYDHVLNILYGLAKMYSQQYQGESLVMVSTISEEEHKLTVAFSHGFEEFQLRTNRAKGASKRASKSLFPF